MDKLLLLLSFLAGNKAKAFALILKAYAASQAADEALKTVVVGGSIALDLPEEVEPRFTSKSGKKFRIDGINVIRVS